jgi:hypothetical protein
LGRFASIRIHRTALSFAVLCRTAEMFTLLGIQTWALQSENLSKSFMWRSAKAVSRPLNIASGLRAQSPQCQASVGGVPSVPIATMMIRIPGVGALGVHPCARVSSTFSRDLAVASSRLLSDPQVRSAADL